MSNQLQENLDAILLDKNTNLKPENLKQGITCLGVNGELEVPEPIYATTDYRVLDVPKPDGITRAISFCQNIDNYWLFQFGSNIDNYLYVLQSDNTFEFLGHFVFTSDLVAYRLGKPGIVGYDNNYIYVLMTVTDNAYYDKLYIFSLNSKEVINTLELTSLPAKGDVLWANNGAFITNQYNHIDEGYSISLLDMKGEQSNILTNVAISTTRGADWKILHKDIPVLYAFSNLRNLREYDINNPNITLKKSQSYTSDIKFIGINYYRNKIFLDTGIYELANDFTIGKKLNDMPKEYVYNTSFFLHCINDKYYAKYLSAKKVELYSFDEETNTLVLEETINNYKGDNADDTQFNLYTTTSIYDFTTGNTIIGYKINGQNVYLNQDRNITTDKILSGYTSYSRDGSPISGTMPNNGDVTIAPTTSEQVKEKGYYNSLKVSAVTSAIDSNIIPENIKKDVSILGINGTLETGTDTSDADATANDIAEGKTAYINGEKITGIVETLQHIFGNYIESINYVPNFSDIVSITASTDTSTPVILKPSEDINKLMMSINISDTELASHLGISSDKIKAGETILGVTGTYTGEIDTSL